MCTTCGCGQADLTLDGHPHTHSHTHEARPGRRRVSLEQSLLARNDALADQNRQWLAQRGILALNLVSSPGSGKTTLLNCIACIMEPSAGRITLDGEIVYDDRWLKGDLRRLRLDKIGFIFQYPNLLPFLNATDNVAVVLQLAGLGSAVALARAVELLDYLEVGHRKHAMPSELSGGEAQRVAIARALANRPRIILADEPTAPLDSQRARIVMDLLRRIAVDQDAAIICVTHDEMIVDRFDRIFQLRDGRLASEVATSKLPRSNVGAAVVTPQGSVGGSF
ncbi:lipoprotein-releasing system ATP-binding protein LolD [mine drainage metagenome]|uniref:Lipoprotein-releasing system ATP-binding protein LolD n=1 Tax=mine drainage metagenome TaxID=410659 RepID=A0A1J5PK92_9ZZZZ